MSYKIRIPSAAVLLAFAFLIPMNASASTVPSIPEAAVCSLAASLDEVDDDCAEAMIHAANAAAGCTLVLAAASVPAAGWALVGVILR